MHLATDAVTAELADDGATLPGRDRLDRCADVPHTNAVTDYGDARVSAPSGHVHHMASLLGRAPDHERRRRIAVETTERGGHVDVDHVAGPQKLVASRDAVTHDVVAARANGSRKPLVAELTRDSAKLRVCSRTQWSISAVETPTRRRWLTKASVAAAAAPDLRISPISRWPKISTFKACRAWQWRRLESNTVWISRPVVPRPFAWGTMGDVSLAQLEYFVTVAEEGHVGRAAHKLRVAQPAVSRQIRRLEDELRAHLFLRTPRGMRLSEAGSIFLAHARSILGGVQAARDAVGTGLK